MCAQVIFRMYHEHLSFVLDCVGTCSESLANSDILKVRCWSDDSCAYVHKPAFKDSVTGGRDKWGATIDATVVRFILHFMMLFHESHGVDGGVT